MKNYNIICRKAKITDDLAAIAKYIHLTDPYIYPSICEDPCDSDWETFIRLCANDKNNIFNIDNIFIILNNGIINGIACILPFSKNLTFVENISAPQSILNNIKSSVEGYFKPLIKETMALDGYNISNLCIDEKMRNRGLGTQLLNFCIKACGDKPIYLDSLADNRSALSLYKKCGFVIVGEYQGFSGKDNKFVPCYKMKRDPSK